MEAPDPRSQQTTERKRERLRSGNVDWRLVDEP